MKLSSLRARTTLLFAVTVTFAMVAACTAMSIYARSASDRRADALLRSAMPKVLADLAEGGSRIDISDLTEDTRGANMALTVIGEAGKTLYKTPDAPPGWWNDPDAWHTMEGRSRARRILLGVPTIRARTAQRRQAFELFAIGSFIAAIATAGAWLLVGRTLSPIGALTRQAEAISAAGSAGKLVAPSADTEIVDLTSTLNALLTRLAEGATVRERFHAAASHELRTPLQVLSGQLELALSRERSADEYRAAIEEANHYAQRLSTLTRDLLLLHQLDSSPAPPSTEVDLSAVCWRALASAQPVIQSRGLDVSSSIAPNILVFEPITRVEIVVRNLIENAARYASPGGRIHVEVNPGSVLVYNDCELQGTDWLSRLVEPFYRAGSPGPGSGGGTGLGLAICATVARASNWRLSLEPRGSGIAAEVLFSGSEDAERTPELWRAGGSAHLLAPFAAS